MTEGKQIESLREKGYFRDVDVRVYSLGAVKLRAFVGPSPMLHT